MTNLKYDYSYNDINFRSTHVWSVVGKDGGVHIWAHETSEELSTIFNERFYGGVECHWRKEPDGSSVMGCTDNCWLLKGPCYHDGSSLYFSENILPMLSAIQGSDVPKHIHEYMNSELDSWYRSKIEDFGVQA